MKPSSVQTPVTSTIVVPNTHPMVALLGANDENLRQFERDFPEVDVLVRGNEIHLTGEVAAVALAEQELSSAHPLPEPPTAIVSAWQLGMRTSQRSEKGNFRRH